MSTEYARMNRPNTERHAAELIDRAGALGSISTLAALLGGAHDLRRLSDGRRKIQIWLPAELFEASDADRPRGPRVVMDVDGDADGDQVGDAGGDQDGQQDGGQGHAINEITAEQHRERAQRRERLSARADRAGI